MSDWPAPTKLSKQRVIAIRRVVRSGLVVYRGIRSGGPSDPGDLGIGTYHSTWATIAKCYGKLTQSRIALCNPLVLSSEEAYELIAENFMTCRGNFRKVGAEAATRMLKCLGFDGVVSVSLVRKREWEIVIFP